MNLVVEAALYALSYRSEYREASTCIFASGKWNHESFAAIEPGLLLSHICSEGCLIEVDDRMLTHDDICQMHREFNSPCLEEREVVAMREILLLSLPALDVVTLIEELQLVPFDSDIVHLLNLLTSLEYG